jgi:hypothetical protein
MQVLHKTFKSMNAIPTFKVRPKINNHNLLHFRFKARILDKMQYFNLDVNLIATNE